MPTAVHVKGGRVVGPVEWYNPDHRVDAMPHIDILPELPKAWIERGYELMAAAQERNSAWTGKTGEARLLTQRHADAIVNKRARELVKDSISGHYPAKRAAIELHRAYKARGGTDPTAVSCLLSGALGAVLNSKVGAR